jgi:hypothetical protein
MKSINRTEWSNLILLLAVLLGTFMRLNPTLLAGFAINDGGMFATMVDDLKTSHYRLPEFTTYNHLNVPYAYPPLGFYLGRMVSDLFGWPTTETLRWLPATIASLSILAFYLLAWRLLKNKYYAVVSTLFFALMPRALSWYVMGGGLTRSPGQLFMLLTLASLVRLYLEKRPVDIFLSGLFGGLAVMSHPEAAVHTFVSAVFLWIFLSRTRADFINSIYVGLIALIVSAPWWGIVVAYHGVTPLLNGAATGQKVLAVFNLLFFVFTEESYATVIAVLGLIGVARCLVRREYLLPAWLALPFFVEGRSAAGPAAIPLAMLAAIGLVDVVFLAMQWFGRKGRPDHPDLLLSMTDPKGQVGGSERNILFYVLFFLVFSTYQFGYQLSSATLYPPDQEAMTWVRKNTSATSRFLVLTGTSSVSCDSVMEWFPALTGRQSINTVQGTEWTQGKNFSNYVKSTYAAQKCVIDGDVACLDGAVDRGAYDYIYFSKILRTDNCRPVPSPRTFPYFQEKLQEIQDLKTVYESEDVIILGK